MSMYRRLVRGVIPFVTFAVLVASSVAAGGTSEQSSAQKVQITISIGSHGQFLINQTVSAFMEKYPDISVKVLPVSSVPNEAFQTYATMFAAQDDSIDVIGIDPSWPYHMAKAGWITDLSALFASGDKAELSKFVPETIRINTIDGKLYGMPIYNDALLLYYRKDLLAKYGLQPPKTWAELEQDAKTILAGENNPQLAGYIYQGAKIEGLTCNFVNFLSGSGGSILGGGGKVTVDSPQSRQALDYMVRLVKEGVSPISITTHNPNDDAIQFGNGDAIFMNNWPFALATYEKPDSPVHGKVGIVRMVGEKGPAESCVGGVGVSINNFSRHKQAAWEFIKYLTNAQWNKERAIKSGLLPAREAVYLDPDVVKANPLFAEVVNGAKYLSSRPTTVTPNYLQVSDAIQVNLNQALLGMQSPDQALSKAAAAIKKIQGQD